MLRSKQLAIVLVLLTPSSIPALLAQSTTPTQNSPGNTARPGRRQEPCWQEAGISSSVMQQRREIMQTTRSEVESVCSDSSLTPQQKREKIHQIHAEAAQKMEGLVTEQQMQALRRCQATRGHAARATPNGNPCGSVAEPTEEEPSPEH